MLTCNVSCTYYAGVCIEMVSPVARGAGFESNRDPVRIQFFNLGFLCVSTC